MQLTFHCRGTKGGREINSIEIMKKFLLFLIVSSLSGYHFDLKWDIPDGIDWYATVLKGADTDHDNLQEIIFSSESLRVPTIYELQGCEFNLAHIIDSNTSLLFWGMGDYDGDYLSDVLIEYWLGVGQGSNLRVYESPMYYSHPDSFVWEAYLDNMNIGEGFYIRSWGDLDGDDKTDIFTSLYKYFWIFENVGNNAYDLVLFDSLSPPMRWTFPTVGDFDGDGKMEIVNGGMYGQISVFENTGDNQYELIWHDSLPVYIDTCVSNVYDNLSANDMDQDGKPEIIFHGTLLAPIGMPERNDLFIFEAIGDNEYQLIYYDSLPHHVFNTVGAISDVGDVDGDGVPELVLSTTGDIYVIKAFANDSFGIVWQKNMAQEAGVPYSAMDQLDVEIYDLDNNGLNEIIASLAYDDAWGFLHAKTFIYEKGIDMEWVYPSLPDTFLVDSVETLRWTVYDTIAVESLYIYLTPLSNYPRDLIFEGNPLTDSIYNWTVPDSLGEFKLLLVVTGPGRRDSLQSPTIYITPTGLEERDRGEFTSKEGFLKFPSNPVKPPLKIIYSLKTPSKTGKLLIVDAPGRVIKAFKGLKSGRNRVIWNGLDERGKLVSKGVYFILLEREKKKWVRRVVLWR